MSVGDRLGTSNTQDVLLLALVAVGGYVVYQIFQQLKGLEHGIATGAKAVYAGAQTITAPAANAIAKAWSAMTLAPSMGGVLGNVVFPDGTQTPLSQFTLKSDTLGNVYINDPQTRLLMQLQPHNQDGNWPAVPVTDPSQIGTSLAADMTPVQQGGQAAIDALNVTPDVPLMQGFKASVNVNGFGNVRLGAYSTPMPRSNPEPMRGPRIIRPRRG